MIQHGRKRQSGRFCHTSAHLGCLYLLMLLMGIATPTALAQTQPRGVIVSDHPGVADIDRRVTWLHWWEANQEAYLMRALAKQDEKARGAGPTPELQSKAVESLIEATRLEHDPLADSTITALKIAAITSLGRIGTEKAVDRLIEVTQLQDQDQAELRSAAWFALGISGHPRAEQHLLSAKDLEPADRSARAAALGLLDPGHEKAIAILIKDLVEMPAQADKRVALQSLRLLRADDIAAIGFDVIERSTDVHLASESILAMATQPDTAHADLMLSLLNSGPPATHLNFSDNGLSPATCFAAAQVLDRYQGMYPIHRLERVLTKHVFQTTGSGEGDYYRGAALLSLVPMIDHEDESVLFDALAGKTRVNAPVVSREHRQYERSIRVHERPDPDRPTREYERRDDPIRGYAAIAMGMYLSQFNQGEPGEVSIDRYEHEVEQAQRRMLDHLNRTLTNKNNLQDLRAAAAMGLALSFHPDATGLIAQALQETDKQDVMVIGYGTLAMALRGDDRAAVLARQYLDAFVDANDPDDFDQLYPTETILGLRAMILAVGLVGDEQAVATLKNTWGADPWLSLEIARVLNWLEDDTLAASLTQAINDEADDPRSVLAAMGLGLMYESQRPSRLTRITEGSNYTITARLSTPGNRANPAADNRRNTTARTRCINGVRRAASQRSYETPANVYLYEVMLDP